MTTQQRVACAHGQGPRTSNPGHTEMNPSLGCRDEHRPGRYRPARSLAFGGYGCEMDGVARAHSSAVVTVDLIGER